MKKVVVKCLNEEYILTGEDLKVIDKRSEVLEDTRLVICEGKETIAVFNSWVYWEKKE